MKKWDIDSQYGKEVTKNTKEQTEIQKKKFMIPIYARIVLGIVIFFIVYTILSFMAKDLANYIATVISVVAGLTSFAIASFNAHKADLYNKMNKGGQK